MAFLESPRFPAGISYGVTFGPRFVTGIGVNQGGYESRNRVRTRALCEGECAHAIRTAAELAVLITFFRSVGGQWAGFRFKDWADYLLLYADSALTLVDGTVNQYQLNKVYRVAAGFEEIRRIQKPVTGTFALKDGATPVAAGGGAGEYAFDDTTGIFTLVASQSRTVGAHVVGAAHKVTLSSAMSPLPTIGSKIAINSVSGSAAAVLNGLRHTVTSVSGADITVSTSTTGLTASGGTVDLYRQEAGLTAQGEFDVPCRFGTDHLPARIESVAAYEWGQIPIREIPV